MFGCAAAPMGEEEHPRQCWVPIEPVRHLEMTDTTRRPCTVKGKYSKRSRQGQRWKRNPESNDIREEITDGLGLQQWNQRAEAQERCQRMRQTSNRTARKTVRLEIKRRIVSAAVGV